MKERERREEIRYGKEKKRGKKLQEKGKKKVRVLLAQDKSRPVTHLRCMVQQNCWHRCIAVVVLSTLASQVNAQPVAPLRTPD